MHGLVDPSFPVNWSAPLNAGLLAWWLCMPGQQRGITWRDLCRRNPTVGTLTNMDPATDWMGARGRPGGWGCLDFDGSNDHVVLASDAAQIEPSTAMTLSCWACGNSTTQNDYATIVAKDYSTPRGSPFVSYKIGYDNAGNAKFGGEIAGAAGVGLKLAAGGGALTVGRWYHLCLTFANSNDITFYIDGVSVATANTSGNVIAYSNANLIAGTNSTAGEAWNGKTDDIRLYNRGLSATEVVALFQASKTGYCRELNWIRQSSVKYVFVGSGSSEIAGTAELIIGEGSSALTAIGNLSGTATLTIGSGSTTLTASGTLAGASALTVAAQLITNTSSVTASPGTVIDDNSNSGERIWANPENAVSSNDQYASTTGTGGLKLTNRLRATNFGFSLPPGAIIDRIQFKIEKYALSLDGVTEDQEVRLVIDGVVGGNNKAISGNWSGVEGYVTYDYTPADWGVTVTGADLNDTDFGIVLAINIDGDVDSAFVDHFELTVYYTVAVIAGSSDLTFGSGSSTLSAVGALAASSDIVIDSNAFLNTLNPIVGTATLTFSSSGALQTTARSDLILTAVGTLTGIGALVGQADITFAASVPVIGSLAGSADITIGGTTVATGAGALVGTSQITVSVDSTLIATGILVGSSDLVLGASASSSAQASITGIAALTLEANASSGGGPLLLRLHEEGLFVGLSL